MVGDTGSLGHFTTRLDSAEGLNLTSTATTDVFSLPSNISDITILCDDNGDAIGGESAELTISGKSVTAVKNNLMSFIIIDSWYSTLTITTLLLKYRASFTPHYDRYHTKQYQQLITTD